MFSGPHPPTFFNNFLKISTNFQKNVTRNALGIVLQILINFLKFYLKFSKNFSKFPQPVLVENPLKTAVEEWGGGSSDY